MLARATTRGDRARQRLLVAAVATAGTLVGAAAAIARIRGDRSTDLAPFVDEPGLRVGVVIGAVLLVLPVVLLALQALRLGGAEQVRRLAALRLVGATPAQRRGIAAIRTGRAGLLGGLLAGPGYLLLWVLVGFAAPPGYRLLPAPGIGDLPVWAVVVLLGALVGVLTGTVTAGGPRARTRSARGGVLRIGLAVTVAVLAVAGAVLLPSPATSVLALVVVIGAGLLAREPLVASTVRRLRRRGRAVDVLAAARLAADPAAPTRAAVVLGVAGLALGVQGGLAAETVGRVDAAFYLAGVGLAGSATAVAVLVTSLSLVVAAADQVVSTRRSVAALAALGADPGLHRAVLRRQLTALSLPAALAGCVVGQLAFATSALGGLPEGLALLAPLPVVAVVVLGSVRVAVALVAGPLRAAADPVNLRAP